MKLMKKFLKKFGCIILATVFLIQFIPDCYVSAATFAPVQAMAASKKEKNAEATAAYRYFLMSEQVCEDNICSDLEQLEFAMLDINHDGIKELYTTGDDSYHAKVYSYMDDEVKLIDESFAGSYIWYKNKNLVFSNSAHTGYYPESYAKFANGKMVVLANAEGQDYFDKDGNFSIKYKYYVKGKKVTKKEYKAYVKSLTRNAKKGKITLHKNTESNRKKYVK